MQFLSEKLATLIACPLSINYHVIANLRMCAKRFSDPNKVMTHALFPQCNECSRPLNDLIIVLQLPAVAQTMHV